MLTDYRVQQREYLLEISRALTAQLNLDELLQMILAAAAKMLAGQAGLIALRGHGTETSLAGLDYVLRTEEREELPDDEILHSLDAEFEIRASYGLPETLVPHFRPLLRNIPDRVERSRFRIPGLVDRLAQIVGRLGLPLRQVVALPMAIGKELIGVLYIFRAYGTRFTSNDRQILASFADQAAIAVHNAQLYAGLSREKHRLHAILEFTADGVMILDAANRIVVFNRALAQLTGWSAGEALGREHDDVIEWSHLATDIDMPGAVRGGWPLPSAQPLYVEGDLRRRNGGTISVGITYAPLFDSNGRLVNIIANVRDITRFREADELKSTFISVVSHELKTPVALIKGYADTLMRKDASWDAQTTDESLTVIIEEADRLNRLIDDLLDASRLQAGAMSMEKEDVELDALAQHVVERFGTQTESHEIVAHFPSDFPTVVGSQGRLEQVLNNLVSNAIKYSPEGGRIDIHGRVLSGEVVVTVSDEGVGIPLEEQPRVFERFFRGSRERHQRTPGAGLGLYLARAIVEAHGGQISVESRPGEGTAFSFTIPR